MRLYTEKEIIRTHKNRVNRRESERKRKRERERDGQGDKDIKT